MKSCGWKYPSSCVLALLFCTIFAVPLPAQNKPADPSMDQNASAFAGCYELRLGRWWPWGMGEDTVFATPPKQVELTVERATTGLGKDHFFIRQIPSVEGSRRSAIWIPQDRNHVMLVWSTGFSGVYVNLMKKDRHLSGWAHAHFDFPRIPHVAHVRTEPIACSAR